MWLVESQFPNQEWNPCPLLWKHGVLTTSPLGNSINSVHFQAKLLRNGCDFSLNRMMCL